MSEEEREEVSAVFVSRNSQSFALSTQSSESVSHELIMRGIVLFLGHVGGIANSIC